MLISWCVDLDICREQFSTPKELNVKGIYEWDFANFKGCTTRTGSMIFNIYMAPKFHWVSVKIPLQKFPSEKLNLITLEQNTIVLSFNYDISDEFFNVEYGLYSINVELKYVKLRLLHPKVTLQRFRDLESHKIILQIKIMKRDNGMKVRTIYFGRAQKILTTEHAGNRHYIWTSKNDMESTVFHGIGLRRKTDLIDIDQILQMQKEAGKKLEKLNLFDCNTCEDIERKEFQSLNSILISPRPHIDYTPDNDGYSNSSLVLPLIFTDEQMINIQIFNLKFADPKFIEIRIRWNQILDQILSKKNVEIFCVENNRMQKSFRMEINKRINLTIIFEELDAIKENPTNKSKNLFQRKVSNEIKRILITKIDLSVTQYLLALHYMNDELNPKTC
tara:strand:- start:4335 stop:5504 length:1170 start_codon:yes stop_codon:yes gene_type:complete